MITEQECLDLLKVIGLDETSEKLGKSLQFLYGTEYDNSWKNIIEAVKKYVPNDDNAISDFILSIELYEHV